MKWADWQDSDRSVRQIKSSGFRHQVRKTALTPLEKTGYKSSTPEAPGRVKQLPQSHSMTPSLSVHTCKAWGNIRSARFMLAGILCPEFEARRCSKQEEYEILNHARCTYHSAASLHVCTFSHLTLMQSWGNEQKISEQIDCCQWVANYEFINKFVMLSSSVLRRQKNHLCSKESYVHGLSAIPMSLRR